MATSSVVRIGPSTCMVTCPRCMQGTPIEIAQLQLSQEPLHVSCGCGCILRLVSMDHRRFPRKPVQLKGRLLEVTGHHSLSPITIIDLSLGGVRFTTHLSLQVGESYRIVFSLDDAV